MDGVGDRCYRLRVAIIDSLRFRAFLLLVAFALSIGGQAAMGAAMAARTRPIAPAVLSAAGGSPGCDRAGGAVAPLCAPVSCANLPVIAAQRAIFEAPRAALPVSASNVVGPGISSKPDPHPPRSLPS